MRTAGENAASTVNRGSGSARSLSAATHTRVRGAHTPSPVLRLLKQAAFKCAVLIRPRPERSTNQRFPFPRLDGQGPFEKQNLCVLTHWLGYSPVPNPSSPGCAPGTALWEIYSPSEGIKAKPLFLKERCCFFVFFSIVWILRFAR